MRAMLVLVRAIAVAKVRQLSWEVRPEAQLRGLFVLRPWCGKD